MTLGRPDDHIYLTQKKRRLSDSTQQKVCDSVHVSLFSGLTLSEYVYARNLHCQSAHSSPCSKCEGFLNVAKLVIEPSYCNLSNAFAMLAPMKATHMSVHVAFFCRCH